MTLVITLLAAALLAQPAEAPPAATAPSSITFQARGVPREQRAPVAYEAGALIVFKATIAGREVWALLDTGAEASVMDVGLAREAGLAMATRVKGARTASGDIPTWDVADVPMLIPGQFEARHPKMPAIDLSSAPGMDGRKLGFVLGRDFLRPLVLLVDPERRTFQLGNSGSFRSPPGATALDLTPGLPQVTATLEGKPVKLNLDTGLNGELSVSPEAWDRLVPPDAAVWNAVSMDAVGRQRTTRNAQRPDFVLGPARIASVKVTDSPRAFHGADGDMGMSVLSRFRFALDLSAGKLWLSPVRSPTPAAEAPTPRP